MSTTARARQRTQPEAADQRATVADRIRRILDADEGLAAENSKLKDLEARRAALQSELDQVTAAAAVDAGELADRLLAGDDLSGLQSVVSKRDCLRQQLAAYGVAISRQQAAVTTATRAVSAAVSAELRPDFIEHYRAFIAASLQLQESFDRMREFHDAAGAVGISLDATFAIHATDVCYRATAGLKHVRDNWPSPAEG